MKVKDLIKELQKQHPEARVHILVPEFGDKIDMEEKEVESVVPLCCNQFELVIK